MESPLAAPRDTAGKPVVPTELGDHGAGPRTITALATGRRARRTAIAVKATLVARPSMAAKIVAAVVR